MSDLKPTRLDQMDYLRGLAALGIMCYHYGWWWFDIHFESNDFLGVVGIYGVSVFYVLSGFTLQWVYGQRIQVDADWKIFYRKRFFRIFPLFIVVTLLTLAISKVWPDWRTIVYNLTGVFGFFAWDRSIAAGGWSIGNELVFYALFPLMIIRGPRWTWIGLLLFMAVAGLHIYFAFGVMQSDLPIVNQWRGYSSPLNQLWFFFAGILLCHFLQGRVVKPIWGHVSMLLVFACLIVYPAFGDQAHLVQGWHRIVLSLLMLLLVAASYWIQPLRYSVIHRSLSWLGACSYSIYLIHPIVYKVIKVGNERVVASFVILPIWLLLFISVIATGLLAHVVYHRLEKYFMRMA